MFRRLAARPVSVVLLMLPIFLSASSASGQSGPDRATVSFTMWGTDRQTATSLRSSNGLQLRVGEQRSTFLFTSFDGGSRGTTFDAKAAAAHPVSWRLEGRLLTASVDLVTFDLNWERLETKDGVSRKVAGDHRTITLRQGERHILDFLRCPLDAALANIVIDVQASPTEEDIDALIELRYDLWLVHETTGGNRIVRKITLTGRQGQKLPFRFDPIPLPIDAGAVDSPLRLEVEGAIAAREAADGTVRVALKTSRNLRFPGGGGASTGEKVLALKPGDNVAIELPNEDGVSSWKVTGELPRIARPGVTVNSGIVRVDEGKFEAGTITSITLTVKRER